jgi:hypothetical protein
MTKQITINLDSEEGMFLESLAKRKGTSLNDVMRQGLHRMAAAYPNTPYAQRLLQREIER